MDVESEIESARKVETWTGLDGILTGPDDLALQTFERLAIFKVETNMEVCTAERYETQLNRMT